MEDRLHYLFKRYLENTCSRNELEEFLAYVDQAKEDKELRALIKKVYNSLEISGAISTHVNEKGRLVTADPEWVVPVKPVKMKSYARYMVAATIIIATGILWLTTRSSNEKTILASSLTKKGTNRSESKFLLLEDSTQVWLNAASSLEFPDQFDTKKREVYLSGEAFFDVKHADRIPFIIHTGSVSTTVLGTAFNIKAYPGEKNITIAVSRGKVKITRKDGWVITLTKGQQLKLNESEESSIEKNVPAESIAGWQQGNIVYDDEALVDIIADMERLYNVDIHLLDPVIVKLHISTSFKKEIGVEQALQVLCRLTESKLTKEGNDYIIQ
jgi:ferric-dicitrate binding protein FerR (iron transport regulator)